MCSQTHSSVIGASEPQHLQAIPPAHATDEQEATQSKIDSLVLIFGAVVMLVLLNPQYSLDLQLIANVIILQTLPLVTIARLHPLVRASE